MLFPLCICALDVDFFYIQQIIYPTIHLSNGMPLQIK